MQFEVMEGLSVVARGWGETAVGSPLRYSPKPTSEVIMANKIGFDSRELFRYVKIEQPRITDLSLRTKQNKSLSAVLKKKKTDQEKWAQDFINSDKKVSSESDLSFPYFDHLKITSLDPVTLPTVRDLRDKEAFQRLNPVTDRKYITDRENALASVMAYRILDMSDELDQAARLLSFIDEFPRLANTTRRRPYARPVYERIKFKTPKPAKPTKSETSEKPSRHDDMVALSNDVRLLWQVKNQMKRTLLNEYEAEIQKLKRARFVETEPQTKSKAAAKKTVSKKKPEKAPIRQPIDRERQQKHIAFLKERNARLAELRAERKAVEEQSTLESIILAGADKLALFAPGKSPDDIRQVQTRMKTVMNRYDIPYGNFCRVYDKAVADADREPISKPFQFKADCFLENPKIAFENTIRILGLGNLIKVEETFISYRPAEISYIENILPGEVRKREVKSTRYFEQIQETVREETTETTQENSTTTEQELSSEIDSEINTRFNSDINASANASGSGTIGVVDLSGGAAVSAGLGIGIDTSLATSDSSKFSQEIVNKAVEKTKKSTLERRLTRSYSLFETTDFHKIDNQGGPAKNGIYVFLDKEVCITETSYGKRLFLLANVMLPGKNLLCEKLAKIQMAMLEQGQKPVFDIYPQDIHPHNYQQLVGKFKASYVQPPPAPTQVVARTYKTDATNANVEQQEFNIKKVADVLVPFFEQYKRFIITDTLAVPDGYEAQQVTVTINHGSNGLSIPAHLPISLAGATMYAAPSLLTAIPFAGLTLPLVFWQIAYLASPLLHYNTDSSNVTVTVGHESYDSPYYFFEPELLIREIFDLLGNFSALTPGILEKIQGMVETLMNDLGIKAAELSGELGTKIAETINSLTGLIQPIFSKIYDLFAVNFTEVDFTDPLYNNRLTALYGELFTKLPNEIIMLVTALPGKFTDLMGEDFFVPISEFITGVRDLISAEMTSALTEFFEYLTTMLENIQNFDFYSIAGMRGQIPISLNTVSVKPGVSVTLTLCAVRTEEALDQWRLDTFTSLYQAYLQQMAEYENRLLMMDSAERMTTSPGNMRREEWLAIKELALHTLNNYHSDRGNSYDLERINFFENAIDWNNMSYRIFNYGPNLKEILMDKLGMYQHVDDRRRVFLKAHWAQVLIPVHEHETGHFEAQVMQYFDEDGTFNFEGDFKHEELVALYQDLILGREQPSDPKPIGPPKTIPTDFVVIQEPELEKLLPKNDDHVCP